MPHEQVTLEAGKGIRGCPDLDLLLLGGAEAVVPRPVAPMLEMPPASAPEPPVVHEPAARPSSDVSMSPLPGGRGPRRPARYGLTIQFERRPDDPAISRLVESTVWVNEDHPAYRRALASRSEGYHLALSVGMALAPLAVDAAEAHGFISAFLGRWGEAAEAKLARRGRRRG